MISKGYGRVVVIVALSFATLFACAHDVEEPEFLSAPVIAQNPNPAVPLAAILSFEAANAHKTRVAIDDGERKWTVVYDRVPTIGEPLAVLGMRPDREFELTVAVLGEQGRETIARQAIHYKTPALPTDRYDWPAYETLVSDPSRMEPGITIVQVRRWPLSRPQQMTPAQRKFVSDYGMLLGLDETGEVVWYYKPDHALGGFEILDNGNILYSSTSAGGVIEVDMLGNKLNTWYGDNHDPSRSKGTNAMPLGVRYLHHQPSPARPDTFLAFSIEPRTVPNYYTSESDPTSREEGLVLGDLIIEFNREGEILWSWNTFDHLDVFQIGYEAFDPFWSLRGFPGGIDWTHGNGISYDATDDSVIASFKLLDAVVKIDRKSGEIVWILGDPAGWGPEFQDKLLTPVGDNFRWFYHQHNPRWTDAGTMLVFNNNRGQTKPFDGKAQVPPEETYSYTIEYEIDEVAGTVEAVWISEPEMTEESCNSFIMSESRRLPETGNIIEFNGMCVPAGKQGATWDAWDLSKMFIEEFSHGGRVREYSRNEPAGVVFELRFWDPYEVIGWQNYGGLKTPSLYGPGVRVQESE